MNKEIPQKVPAKWALCAGAAAFGVGYIVESPVAGTAGFYVIGGSVLVAAGDFISSKWQERRMTREEKNKEVTKDKGKT